MINHPVLTGCISLEIFQPAVTLTPLESLSAFLLGWEHQFCGNQWQMLPSVRSIPKSKEAQLPGRPCREETSSHRNLANTHTADTPHAPCSRQSFLAKQVTLVFIFPPFSMFCTVLERQPVNKHGSVPCQTGAEVVEEGREPAMELHAEMSSSEMCNGSRGVTQRT